MRQSASIKANNEGLLRQARQAVKISVQLWQTGGMSAKEQAQLLPELLPLLQPIQVKDTDQPIAFTLTEPLLSARQQVSSDGEWLLALLALHADIRRHWLGLAAARCREAGQIADPMVLIKLISNLGNASEWLLPFLSSNAESQEELPRLTVGPLAELERELLGVALHENAAIPALMRVLHVSSVLSAVTAQSQNSVFLIDITGTDFAENWCAGRLLALPAYSEHLAPNPEWLLTNSELPEQSLADSEQNLIYQFNHQPWLLLLSLLIFTQDAWAAEQREGLLLELPNGQNPFAPSEVLVVVQGIEGDEIKVGSLADLFFMVLRELEINLYPQQLSAGELNRQLSPLIGQSLQQNLWLFKDGGRGESGQYRIHPNFSDACYSLPLSPLFGRKSKYIQQVIKHCALQTREQAFRERRLHREEFTPRSSATPL